MNMFSEKTDYMTNTANFSLLHHNPTIQRLRSILHAKRYYMQCKTGGERSGKLYTAVHVFEISLSAARF